MSGWSESESRRCIGVALTLGEFGTGLDDAKHVHGLLSLLVMKFELKPVRHQLSDHRLPLLDAWITLSVGLSGDIVAL